MLLDALAGIAAAGMLSSSSIHPETLRSVQSPVAQQSWLMVAAQTETREGIYGEYTVEKKEQELDDAASTFKSKEATEKGKVCIMCVGC